jgi:protein TonB
MKKPLAEITESGQQARIAEKHATSTAQSVAATSVTQSHPSARRGVPGGRVLAANTTAGELYFIEPRFRAPPRPPVYPRRARQLEQEGEALIRVKLDPRGNAAEVLVWKSSGFALLDAAAMTAVRGWRFVPAHRDGKAIVAWVEIPVRFALN